MAVFFCYSHEDKNFVDTLAKQLSDHKYWVWVDRWEIKVGDSILGRIQDVLRTAEAIIFVISKSSTNSHWATSELKSILHREQNEKKTLILPALIEDCDIPLLLADRLYADFRTNYSEGFQTLMNSLSAYTSITQARIEEPKSHSDWSIYVHSSPVQIDEIGIFDGRITITSVDHGDDFDYSILTEINIHLSIELNPITQELTKQGLEWYHIYDIINHISRDMIDKRHSIMITDTKPIEQHFLTPSHYGFQYPVSIKVVWLGNDSGQVVKFKICDTLDRISTTTKQRMQPLDKAKRQKYEQILNLNI